MRVLVAPQEFKGSLTAREAAEAIASGLRRAAPEAHVDLLPMADGGPGTVEALVAATHGSFFEATVHDPLGRPVRARWGVLDGQEDSTSRTAVIEMAAASGLALLQEGERDPARASTMGTGELLLAALDAGFRGLIVGAGGSATNDGGAGMAQVLGARLLDGDGRELGPGGGALGLLSRIDVSDLDPRLREVEVVVATDVTNPLCGPDGASLVYGPQKGADGDLARELDAALRHYADVIRRDVGMDVVDEPGAGAAGGLGAGLIAFCGAKVLPGFDVVARAAGLAGRVRDADAVVTGEGRLDRQTGFGKTAAGVARLAQEAGKPVIALVGSVADDCASEARSRFDAIFALTPELAPPDEAVARAADLLPVAAERAARWLGDKV